MKGNCVFGLRNANKLGFNALGLYDTDVCLVQIDENDKPIGMPMQPVEAKVLEILGGNIYTLHPPVDSDGVIFYATVDNSLDDATTCILDMDFLDIVADELGDNYYILPFSTRVLGFVKRDTVPVKILARVVYNTNRANTKNNGAGRLSDSIWMYDRLRHTIKTAWFGGDIDEDYWQNEEIDISEEEEFENE